MSLIFSQSIVWMVGLILVLGVSLPAASDDKETDFVLRHFEGQLQKRGLNTDEAALIQALANTEPQVRWLAAALLGLQQYRTALPALRQRFAEEPDVRPRVEMAHAMAKMGDETGHDFLRQTLTMDGPLARKFSAAQALIKLGDPLGYPVVLTMLAEPVAGRRLNALESLRQFAPFAGRQVDGMTVTLPEVLGKVIREDGDPIVRMTAVMVLSDSSDATSCTVLQHALNDADARVRAQADAAAQRFGCQTVERKKP